MDTVQERLILELRFEAENVLKMFLIKFTWYSISINQETYKSALHAVIWYQVACYVLARLAVIPRTNLLQRISGNNVAGF